MLCIYKYIAAYYVIYSCISSYIAYKYIAVYYVIFGCTLSYIAYK